MSLVIFDLETTGININVDRIVEFGAILVEGRKVKRTIELRINPEIPIPPQATSVHGITNAHVDGCPTIREVGQDIVDFIGDSILGGFNSTQYDVPLLLNELSRAGVGHDLYSRPQIDVLRLYRALRPKKDLAGIYEEYTGKQMSGAHNAMCDVLATWDILDSQMSVHSLGSDVDDVLPVVQDKLQEVSLIFADPVGQKFVWRDGAPHCNFGKNTGKSLKNLARYERGFLSWMLKQSFEPDTLDLVRSALAGEIPTKETEAAAQ